MEMTAIAILAITCAIVEGLALALSVYALRRTHYDNMDLRAKVHNLEYAPALATLRRHSEATKRSRRGWETRRENKVRIVPQKGQARQ